MKLLSLSLSLPLSLSLFGQNATTVVLWYQAIKSEKREGERCCWNGLDKAKPGMLLPAWSMLEPRWNLGSESKVNVSSVNLSVEMWIYCSAKIWEAGSFISHSVKYSDLDSDCMLRGRTRGNMATHFLISGAFLVWQTTPHSLVASSAAAVEVFNEYFNASRPRAMPRHSAAARAGQTNAIRSIQWILRRLPLAPRLGGILVISSTSPVLLRARVQKWFSQWARWGFGVAELTLLHFELDGKVHLMF